MIARPYPVYKDSGIGWIPRVPSDWEITRIKTRISLVTEKAAEKTNPVALEHIESGSGRMLHTDGTFDADGIKFRRGDVLFGKLRPYLAKSWLADSQGEAVGDFLVLRPRRGVYARFFHYVTLSPEFIRTVNGSTFGSKMPRASWDFIGNMPCPFPDLDTQQRVTVFLDRETSRLDMLIGKQERLIELLAEKRQAIITQAVTKGLDPSAPTKPSGTPWQGPVPENWSVQPLKNLVRIQTGVTLGTDYSNAKTESFAYLRVANVQVGRVDLTDVKRIDLPADQAVPSLLQKGDVLMTEGGDRDKLARGCIWDAPIAPCVHQNHVFAARTKSTLFNEFLVLVLDAAPARTYFFQTGKQSTNLASTNSTTVKNFRFGLPPLDEQHLIVQEVKSKTEKIDTLTAKARAVISVVQERRSALISAAVTGKIDVREGAA